MLQTNEVTLKFKELLPRDLRISSSECFKLKIAHSNDFSMSEMSSVKKNYYFMIEELDEEVGPLKEGEEYTFQPIASAGIYNLVCSNYPKIAARIEVYHDVGKLSPTKVVSE